MAATACSREVVLLALDTLRANKLRSGADGARRRHRHHRDRRHDVADPRLRPVAARQHRELGPNTIFVAKFSGVSLAGGRDFAELLRRPNLTVGGCQGDREAGAVGRASSTSGSAAAATSTQERVVLPRRAHEAAGSPRRHRGLRRRSIHRSCRSAASSPRAKCRIAAASSSWATRRMRRCSAKRHRPGRQAGAHRRDRIHGHRRARQAPSAGRFDLGQDDFVRHSARRRTSRLQRSDVSRGAAATASERA